MGGWVEVLLYCISISTSTVWKKTQTREIRDKWYVSDEEEEEEQRRRKGARLRWAGYATLPYFNTTTYRDYLGRYLPIRRELVNPFSLHSHSYLFT